jgi:hypothetical protein
MTPASLDHARAAKLTLAGIVDDLPELRGLGIAMLEGGFGVKVNLSCIPRDRTIPTEVDGVPVIVEVVGTITAR